MIHKWLKRNIELINWIGRTETYDVLWDSPSSVERRD